ncbi:MAG: hypothetical protein O7H41_18265 [Planctomycetota bacterium]|nr:hypothetical protein [Planctomycetota bacterium]
MRFTVTSAVLAGVLAVFVLACDGGGGKRRAGASGLPCGIEVSGSISGSGQVTPIFTSRKSVAFYDLGSLPQEVTAVNIILSSTNGDANLHLAAPGVTRGSTNPADYIISSQAAFPINVDSLRISLIGIEGPGFSIPSPTLKDYMDAGGGASFAIWGVLPQTRYDLQITCESFLAIPCGRDVAGSVPGSGTAPPDFAAGTEVQFFEIRSLPIGPGSVSILATSLTGDTNLYVGRPGMTSPSGDPADWIFSSTAPESASINDLVIIDNSGLHDVFGATNPTITLTDYRFSGGTLWFATAGLAGSNEYTLRVSCSMVDRLGCGDNLNGVVNGSSLSPPDLANPLETRFYRIDPLPPTATRVEITLQSLSGADADFYLAAPGVPPGSDVGTDYVFSSEVRSPSSRDQIIIDMAGVRDGLGGSTTAVTLDDYLQAGTPLGLAVAGYEPLTSFTISTSCVAPPQILPMACGGSVSGAVAGSGQDPPDLSDLGENVWYELMGIPPGTSRIEIFLEVLNGDADLRLAAPGVPPGSQSLGSYPVVSDSPFGDEYVVICATGTVSTRGSRPAPTLADYAGASENLSLVISGTSALTSFNLTVRCSSGPSQIPASTLSCGGAVTDQVSGSMRFPPDFTIPGEVRFYETPVAPGSQFLSISLSSAPGGNADIYLAAPGVAPGSTCNADYLIGSTQSFSDDLITIAPCGISAGFFTLSSPSIADYEAAGSVSFVVVGFAPLTTFTVDVSCGGGPNPVRPIDCAGTATDTVQGGFSFADPTVSHIYEIPLASVQAASSIRMEADVGFSDADLYLAVPGVVPGSVCASDYPFSTFSVSNPDWIQIDTNGFSAADGTFFPFVTIADYQAASTNLSFVVQGWITTTYTLRIICN